MAYCVQCGVKLADGAASCPLCNTVVLLPPGIEESSASPLFAQKLGKEQERGVTKWRKGIIELTAALAVVSIIALGLSLGLSGLGRYSYIPILSVAALAVTLIALVLAKPTYTHQATVLLACSAFFLLALDWSDRSLFWSLIAAPAHLVAWVVAVGPWTGIGVRKAASLGIATVLSFLMVINVVVTGSLTWFVPVALPTMVCALILTALFVLFFVKRKSRLINVVDVVMATLVILFGSIASFDLFLTHYQRGLWTLRWSLSLVYSATVILLFLLAITCSRRLRRYFTTHIRHS